MAEEGDDELARFLEVPASDDPAVLDDDRRHIYEQLQAKKWDDLGVLEYEGRLLFPEKIWRRNREGEFVSDSCVLVLPRGPDLRRARVEAYKLAGEDHIDPTKDRDLFGDLETACILWGSIRSPSPGPGEMPEPLCMNARELERRYDRTSLMQVNGKLEHLRRVIDPKVNGLSPGEFVALTAAMVARQDLTPLFACNDATQHYCLLTLAALHQAVFGKGRYSPGSSAPSTAGSSAAPSSSPSSEGEAEKTSNDSSP